jgi:hypothetical protein
LVKYNIILNEMLYNFIIDKNLIIFYNIIFENKYKMYFPVLYSGSQK